MTNKRDILVTFCYKYAKNIHLLFTVNISEACVYVKVRTCRNLLQGKVDRQDEAEVLGL